jgi:2-polyprenyl-6-hydroxyphenyl methylase/3-demethylubiquinone-9 3-methyltransferase
MHDGHQRFGFGANWLEFSKQIDDSRIATAEAALRDMLGQAFAGKSFLDIGCGSGLSSLAARRLDARVRSFDYDQNSVECTRRLRERYRPDDPDWQVEQGSILDQDFIARLGTFDIVYSWGVLHHTGNMRQAIANAASLVSPGGLFMIAIYHKTPFCWMWKIEKRWYVSASDRGQRLARALYRWADGAIFRLRAGRIYDRLSTYAARSRGMDYERDVHDWLGGYPYESTTSDKIRAAVDSHGFQLVREKIVSSSGLLGTGNDEYVFHRP